MGTREILYIHLRVINMSGMVIIISQGAMTSNVTF